MRGHGHGHPDALGVLNQDPREATILGPFGSSGGPIPRLGLVAGLAGKDPLPGDPKMGSILALGVPKPGVENGYFRPPWLWDPLRPLFCAWRGLLSGVLLGTPGASMAKSPILGLPGVILGDFDAKSGIWHSRRKL